MLLKYFNGNKLSVFVTIPLLMVLCWVPGFVVPVTAPAAGLTTWGVLGKYITVFNNDHQLVASIAAIMIVMINGFLLLQINTIYIFIPKRTQIPALFYMLLCSVFPDLGRFSPALLASSLIILLLFRIFATYKKESLSYNFLDAGMLISLASLFYFPALFYYPVLLIVMFIIRPYIWREWIYTLIGLLLPYIFLLSFYYLMDVNISDITDGITRTLFVVHESYFGMGSRAFLAFMSLIIIIGSLHMMRVIGTGKIQSRKFFISFLWIFMVSLLAYFVIPAAGIEMVYFISIPVSFLAGNYFALCRQNWVNNVLLFLFFIGIAAVKVFG